MAEKISIITLLDLEKLDIKISKYSIRNGTNDIYLFANRQTIKQMIKQIVPNIDPNATKLLNMSDSALVEKYKGCKVFTDDTLDFGEIELR